MTLRLLSYKIRYGGVGREAPLAEVIRNAAPDLLILQEATRPAVVERLARETGMTQWGSRRRASLGFLSRVAVAHAGWYRPRLSRHAFLEIVLEGQFWRAFGVHLSAVQLHGRSEGASMSCGRCSRPSRAASSARVPSLATSTHLRLGSFSTWKSCRSGCSGWCG